MSAAQNFGAAQWLNDPVVPIAWCWRIDRRDGVVLGLTTHDAPLMLGGLIYHSAPGIRPSAIVQRRGLTGDTMDIAGALSADAISATDLADGRWNGARLTLLIADWQAPDARHLTIATGALGAVASDGRGFTAELSARDAVLDAPACPETSAECRAELGDAQCRVAMAGRTHRAQLVAVDGRDLVMSTSFPDGDLNYGRLRWLSGGARGLSVPIAAQIGNRLTCGRLPEQGAAGDWVEIRQGCDKRAETCATRFANIANFRGEPHLPGIDLLTRFPGG